MILFFAVIGFVMGVSGIGLRPDQGKKEVITQPAQPVENVQLKPETK